MSLPLCRASSKMSIIPSVAHSKQPLTAQGRFALARALLLEGHRAAAQNLVREALRDGGAPLNRLLRPAGPGPAQAQGHCDAVATRPRLGPSGRRERDLIAGGLAEL